MRGAICYHLHNLKNVKNTHGGVSLLVKLQAYFTKSNNLYGCFLRFSKCTNSTKLCNVSLWKLTASDKVFLDTVLK